MAGPGIVHLIGLPKRAEDCRSLFKHPLSLGRRLPRLHPTQAQAALAAAENDKGHAPYREWPSILVCHMGGKQIQKSAPGGALNH